jgi:hypothetical protein
MGDGFRSLSFAGITSSPSMEARSQALVSSSGKAGLCGGSAPELMVDAA